MHCKSILGFRAIARMLSGENFFKGCNKVEYGVRRYNPSSFGLISSYPKTYLS